MKITEKKKLDADADVWDSDEDVDVDTMYNTEQTFKNVNSSRRT